MGQYYVVANLAQYYLAANLTKREFLDPYRLGSGGKLVEMFYSDWFSKALLAALALGDWTLPDHPFVGRWAGDQVILVGDCMNFDYVSRLISDGKLNLPSYVVEELKKLDEDESVVDSSFYSFVKNNFKDVSVEAIKFIYRVDPEEGLQLAMELIDHCIRWELVSPKDALQLLEDKELKKALQQKMGKDFQKALYRIKRLAAEYV
jgi:hypothetical protein